MSKWRQLDSQVVSNAGSPTQMDDRTPLLESTHSVEGNVYLQEGLVHRRLNFAEHLPGPSREAHCLGY
ncbi:hypothetical protein NDU88_003959 [Pleurodeles waltl]|uniref:Uncharacterized protein n=1 Tax=Pleurodeles waltl TaxID=8319 RepID=A0AAV7SHE7_PLEWA|nr:hypothetical protein NDU88_003959 [Pleurodeles waltl]